MADRLIKLPEDSTRGTRRGYRQAMLFARYLARFAEVYDESGLSAYKLADLRESPPPAKTTKRFGRPYQAGEVFGGWKLVERVRPCGSVWWAECCCGCGTGIKRNPPDLWKYDPHVAVKVGWVPGRKRKS